MRESIDKPDKQQQNPPVRARGQLRKHWAALTIRAAQSYPFVLLLRRSSLSTDQTTGLGCAISGVVLTLDNLASWRDAGANSHKSADYQHKQRGRLGDDFIGVGVTHVEDFGAVVGFVVHGSLD